MSQIAKSQLAPVSTGTNLTSFQQTTRLIYWSVS
jgi:hypothetical protein